MFVFAQANGFGRAHSRALRPARAALAAALLGGALTSSASAQIAVNRVELSLRSGAGTNHVEAIGVKNEGDRPVQAIVRLEDWDRSLDGTNRWYPLGTLPQSCKQVLSIFPLSLTLEPGASQMIRVALDSGATPAAECWSAAVVETVRPEQRNGQMVAYVLRTAVKIYVQPGGLRSDGDIADFRVENGGADARDAGAEHLEIEFQNTGTRHVLSKGSVEFRRPDNSVAATVPIPDIYALPGAHHRVRFAMPNLARGHYVAIAMLDFGGDELSAAQFEYEVK